MQNILLAGPTGNLGPHLAKALKNNGKDVFALVRPKTMADPGKILPLKELGVHLVEGDLNDQPSLEKACKGMDAVISAVGGNEIQLQENLLNAAIKAGVKRFMPSEFGLDPLACERGTCLLFDAKAGFQKKLKASGMDYTMFYTNGFMEFWAFGLGELGNSPDSGHVTVFGSGNVNASMTGLPDIARFTVALLDDPEMKNREARLTTNEMTQEALIRLWEKISDSTVQRMKVTESELNAKIQKAQTESDFSTLIPAQLHRSVWVYGETMHKRPDVLEATRLYPDLPVQSVEAFFHHISEPVY